MDMANMNGIDFVKLLRMVGLLLRDQFAQNFHRRYLSKHPRKKLSILRNKWYDRILVKGTTKPRFANRNNVNIPHLKYKYLFPTFLHSSHPLAPSDSLISLSKYPNSLSVYSPTSSPHLRFLEH